MFVGIVTKRDRIVTELVGAIVEKLDTRPTGVDEQGLAAPKLPPVVRNNSRHGHFNGSGASAECIRVSQGDPPYYDKQQFSFR
jgi:hypothetical protein